MAITNKKRIAEFGDFQTPPALAADVCELLKASGVRPASVVEPTCGIGNFLIAALKVFPAADRVIGVDINSQYVATARSRIAELADPQKVELHCGSFFAAEWDTLASLAEPILAVGNPPWVTNAHLSSLGSNNLPTKSNFQNHAGFDAIAGKSNFDISEWMLIHLLEQLQQRRATIAMLCKTAVARKVLNHAWKNGLRVENASVRLIDASEHFRAAVDACLLVCHSGGISTSHDCRVFDTLQSQRPTHTFGYRDGQIVADVDAYEAWKHLQGKEQYRWRSGIKHDCAAVMELRRLGSQWTNGLGQRVTLEPDYLYPMLKSSDIANGSTETTERYMLVPQLTTGTDTTQIKNKAPMTWAYLHEHGDLLDRRGSSIYKKRGRFSIFGVGSYSFMPWKVVISGFYKSLNFRQVGPIDGKPTVLDDTCNFIACRSSAEAELMTLLLNSPQVSDFFRALIFWDAKRPLTVDLLRKLDLRKVAESAGRVADFDRFVGTEPEADTLFANA